MGWNNEAREELLEESLAGKRRGEGGTAGGIAGWKCRGEGGTAGGTAG